MQGDREVRERKPLGKKRGVRVMWSESSCWWWQELVVQGQAKAGTRGEWPKETRGEERGVSQGEEKGSGVVVRRERGPFDA